MATEKGPGRGRGRFTAAGAQADLEARVAALEDIVADAVDSGVLPEPPLDEGMPADTTEGSQPA